MPILSHTSFLIPRWPGWYLCSLWDHEQSTQYIAPGLLTYRNCEIVKVWLEATKVVELSYAAWKTNTVWLFVPQLKLQVYHCLLGSSGHLPDHFWLPGYLPWEQEVDKENLSASFRLKMKSPEFPGEWRLTISLKHETVKRTGHSAWHFVGAQEMSLTFSCQGSAGPA